MRAFASAVCWVLACLSGGCASQWKVKGPEECVQMCKHWNMELTGMVGVGSQDASGPGATACVCQVKKAADAPPTSAVAASGTSAGMSAAIVALEEAQREEQQRHQQEQLQVIH